jgi:enoyl-[acyl-carrier protein] reductase I
MLMTNTETAAVPAPLLKGKRGLIMGVANERSLAWGISTLAAAHGAELGFTYPAEALGKRVTPLAQSLNSTFIEECDVANEVSIDALFDKVEKQWGSLDFLVHAIGFSDKKELDGRYVDTSKQNFLNTMDISAFSFTSVAKRAEKLMPNGGSLLTLTYYGAEKVMPHYNVMGVAKAALEASVRYLAVDLGRKNIRVNAISAGPIKTLAASGISDFRYILRWNELNAPLKRNVSIQDVGGAALFLLSELGAGVSGEVMHVDAGYHAVGMVAVEEAGNVAELLQSLKTSE